MFHQNQKFYLRNEMKFYYIDTGCILFNKASGREGFIDLLQNWTVLCEVIKYDIKKNGDLPSSIISEVFFRTFKYINCRILVL